MNTNHVARADLNPGEYCGEKDREYSLRAERHFEGSVTYVSDLRVNGRSPGHAKTLAEKAGYIVKSSPRKIG